MLKKEQYFRAVRRPYPPFFAYLIYGGMSNYSNYKPFINKRFAIRNNVKSSEAWYYSKKEIEQVAHIVLEEWTNLSKLKKVREEFSKREKALIRATKMDLSNFCRAYEFYMPALILVWAPENLAANKIKKLLFKKIPSDKAKKLLNQLQVSLEDNFYKKEEHDLVISTNLEKHVKEYEWIKSRYGEENPYTIKEAKKNLPKIDKKVFLQEREKEKIGLKQAINKAKIILGKQNEHIVDVVQYMIYYRTHRTDIMNKSAYLFIPQLKKIAKKNGLTYKQILYCTRDEILNKIPSIEIIKNRIKDHAMIMEDGKIRCVSGKESERVRKFFEDKIYNISELKGTITSGGIVKGCVRVVFSRDNFNKVKKGDVLVTSMTTPEMIPIMKKAAAFITDEGGITCHAAIISREMKKPCIIGTKIATKVLKDGDLVEVDAERGVVRILKK